MAHSFATPFPPPGFDLSSSEFRQLGLPPYSLRPIYVPRIPQPPTFAYAIEPGGGELSCEVFLGQLSYGVCEERVRSLLQSVFNDVLRTSAFIGRAVIHRRRGVCGFATLNAAAVEPLLTLNDSILLEESCDIAWVADSDRQRELLAGFLAARKAWPWKAITIELRTEPSPPRSIAELVVKDLVAAHQPGSLGLHITLPPSPPLNHEGFKLIPPALASRPFMVAASMPMAQHRLASPQTAGFPSLSANEVYGLFYAPHYAVLVTPAAGMAAQPEVLPTVPAIVTTGSGNFAPGANSGGGPVDPVLWLPPAEDSFSSSYH
jgi:hypothetical protein